MTRAGAVRAGSTSAACTVGGGRREAGARSPASCAQASREAWGSHGRSSASGHRGAPKHAAGPGRGRASRVCPRHGPSARSPGPCAPSRPVSRLHTSGASERRPALTACPGAGGRRPRPRAAGHGASRARRVVAQGPPRPSRAPHARRWWRHRGGRPQASSPTPQPWGTVAPHAASIARPGAGRMCDRTSSGPWPA